MATPPGRDALVADGPKLDHRGRPMKKARRSRGYNAAYYSTPRPNSSSHHAVSTTSHTGPSSDTARSSGNSGTPSNYWRNTAWQYPGAVSLFDPASESRSDGEARASQALQQGSRLSTEQPETAPGHPAARHNFSNEEQIFLPVLGVCAREMRDYHLSGRLNLDDEGVAALEAVETAVAVAQREPTDLLKLPQAAEDLRTKPLETPLTSLRSMSPEIRTLSDPQASILDQVMQIADNPEEIEADLAMIKITHTKNQVNTSLNRPLTPPRKASGPSSEAISLPPMNETRPKKEAFQQEKTQQEKARQNEARARKEASDQTLLKRAQEEAQEKAREKVHEVIQEETRRLILQVQSLLGPGSDDAASDLSSSPVANRNSPLPDQAETAIAKMQRVESRQALADQLMDSAHHVDDACSHRAEATLPETNALAQRTNPPSTQARFPSSDQIKPPTKNQIKAPSSQQVKAPPNQDKAPPMQNNLASLDHDKGSVVRRKLTEKWPQRNVIDLSPFPESREVKRRARDNNRVVWASSDSDSEAGERQANALPALRPLAVYSSSSDTTYPSPMKSKALAAFKESHQLDHSLEIGAETSATTRPESPKLAQSRVKHSREDGTSKRKHGEPPRQATNGIRTERTMTTDTPLSYGVPGARVDKPSQIPTARYAFGVSTSGAEDVGSCAVAISSTEVSGREARLDEIVYGQLGAGPPPRGLKVKLPPKRPTPKSDGRLFLHSNPATHLTHVVARGLPQTWFDQKMEEIKTRGGRKIWFGRVSERWRWRRSRNAGQGSNPRSRAPATAPDFGKMEAGDLPDVVKRNPAWHQACLRLKEMAAPEAPESPQTASAQARTSPTYHEERDSESDSDSDIDYDASPSRGPRNLWSRQREYFA